MKVSQIRWSPERGWSEPDDTSLVPQLVLLFGGRESLGAGDALPHLRVLWPSAHLLGCSTAGEIFEDRVGDGGLVATAIEFERTRVEVATTTLGECPNGYEVGLHLGRALSGPELKHVFVLSDGLNVNGSELVHGLTEVLPEDVTVTGGLSGDGERFEKTLVLSGERLESDLVTGIGLYGRALEVGYASLGGWDPFGPDRVITRSEGNVLYELDGKSALQLYKDYLGEHARGLPATGLLFPLAIRRRIEDTPVVRTILGIDEEKQSLTFAGDVPQGSFAKLMKANLERLVDGAAGAARTTVNAIGKLVPDLAVLISCVGRRMVLKQRVEEEVEAVREIFGPGTTLTGFYSYGEISPFTPSARCELHNQTMTITAFREELEDAA